MSSADGGFGPHHFDLYHASRRGDLEAFHRLIGLATAEDKDWALEVAAHVDIVRCLVEEHGVDRGWLRQCYRRARARCLVDVARHLEATGDVDPAWLASAWVLRVDGIARRFLPSLTDLEFFRTHPAVTCSGADERLASAGADLRRFVQEGHDPVDERGPHVWFTFVSDREVEELGLRRPETDRHGRILRVAASRDARGAFLPDLEATPYGGELEDD